MRETIGSFVSILIIIFIGCFFFAGISEGTSTITEQVTGYYAEQNTADARAEYMYVNSSAVDTIAATDGVEKAAGYNTFNTRANFGGLKYDAAITTLTPGIDDPYIVSGRAPEAGENEMLVDSVFADAHGVRIGDVIDIKVATVSKITLTMNPTVQYTPEYVSVDYRFTVCGIFHSPDIINKVNLANTSARPDEFIIAFVDPDAIKLFTDDAKVVSSVKIGESVFERTELEYADVDVAVFNGIKILGKPERGKEYKDVFDIFKIETVDQITAIFENPNAPAGLFMYVLERDSYPSIAAFDGINDTLASLAAVLPLMFFAVAAAITVISLSKTVDNQRMQIGVMQALGVSKGNVYFSYLFYALFASLIGGFAGGLVGMYFVPFLLDIIYSNQFCMPPVPRPTHGVYMLLGVAISVVLACVAALVSCYRVLRDAPAQAMRPKPPKKTKRILAERWTGLWKRLGFGAKMNLRNMFLHKMKMFLSSIGIIGCLALLVALIGLKDNMAFSFERYDAQAGYDLTIVTDVAIDLTDPEVYETIGNADEKQYMHHLTFVPDFSGRFEFNGKTADMTVMALPTYADERDYRYADADCVELYTDLRGKERLLFESDTFVIPHVLADELGAKKGDTVKVTGYSLDNRSVDFEIEITDIVYEYFDLKAYCSYDVFVNNDVGLFADTSYATLLPGVELSTALKALDDNEVVRGVKTFRETYDTLATQMSLLDWAVIIFVIGAAALAIAVIYNITATNLKERTREIATLMVLGYKYRETANMLIVENMVITALGCIIGLPLGYALLLWLVDITTSFNVFISSFLSWYVAIGCLVLTFAFSYVATLLLNTKLKKISMVEALKSVE